MSSAAPSQISRISLIQFEKKNLPNSSGYFLEFSTLVSVVGNGERASGVISQKFQTKSHRRTTGYGLQATSYQPPATGHQLPATGHQLPATSYQLPAAFLHHMPGQFCIQNGAKSAKSAFNSLPLTTLLVKIDNPHRISDLTENTFF
jgi:hypothetical protein